MAELGWTVSHPKYGKWFISRDAVIADWKQDRAQVYPDEPEREPTAEEVETWWNEQTTWIEVATNGKQLERPDMAAGRLHGCRKWRAIQTMLRLTEFNKFEIEKG